MQIHRLSRKICLLVAATVIGTSSLVSPAQTNGTVKGLKPIKTSRLIGMRVENRDGVEFGSVRDLALDLRGGRIQYALVASGGFLGVHSRLRPVPPRLLSAATAKRDTLSVKLGREDWDRAPTFRLSELQTLTRPDRFRAINEFYQHAMAEP